MTQDDPTGSGESPAEYFERIGTKLSRRSLMANSAKLGGGAAALTALGGDSVAASSDQEDETVTQEMTDVDILNFALALEKLETTFYERGLDRFDVQAIGSSQTVERTGQTPAQIRARLNEIRSQSQEHLDALSDVVEQLGGTPATGLQFTFQFDTFDQFVEVASEIKTLGVQAYAGAAPFIRTKLLLQTALSIHSVKASQAAYLRFLNGERPATRAFDDPMSMDSVVARASQFIEGLYDDRLLFKVTIENVSDSDTLDTPKGKMSVPISPGAYAIHEGGNQIFRPQKSATEGLERLTEDGFPSNLVQGMQRSVLTELAQSDKVVEMGTFQSMDGGTPVLEAGEKTEFYFTAGGNEDLSIAAMFVPSNDLFVGPDLTGDKDIEIMRNGKIFRPSELGDVTDQLLLYDAGTEQNQQPGVGADQKPNQPLTAIDVGASESKPIRPVEEVTDGYEYPDPSEFINLRVDPVGSGCSCE